VGKSNKQMKGMLKKNLDKDSQHLPVKMMTEKDLESLFGAVEDEEVWHRQQNILKYEIHSHEYIQE
jgi:hypothetical protein